MFGSFVRKYVALHNNVLCAFPGCNSLSFHCNRMVPFLTSRYVPYVATQLTLHAILQHNYCIHTQLYLCCGENSTHYVCMHVHTEHTYVGVGSKSAPRAVFTGTPQEYDFFIQYVCPDDHYSSPSFEQLLTRLQNMCSSLHYSHFMARIYPPLSYIHTYVHCTGCKYVRMYIYLHIRYMYICAVQISQFKYYLHGLTCGSHTSGATCVPMHGCNNLLHNFCCYSLFQN